MIDYPLEISFVDDGPSVFPFSYEFKTRRDLRRASIKEYYFCLDAYFTDLAGWNKNWKSCGSSRVFRTSREAIRDIEEDLLEQAMRHLHTKLHKYENDNETLRGIHDGA